MGCGASKGIAPKASPIASDRVTVTTVGPSPRPSTSNGLAEQTVSPSTETGYALADATSPCLIPLPRASQRAVSLVWLESFVTSLSNTDLTSNQVAEQIVAPALCKTKSLGSGGGSGAGGGPGPDTCAPYGSYAELLVAGGGINGATSAVSNGRPYHYVVHAHSRRFVDTVSMLHKHFAAEAQHDEGRCAEAASDVYVWLDVFANDQNTCVGSGRSRGSSTVAAAGRANNAVDNDDDDSADESADADLDTVREAVAGARSVLLVLDDDAEALKRLWCLYELRLASGMPQSVRVLTYDLDFEALRYAIADLDLSSAIAAATAPGNGGPTDPPFRNLLRELLDRTSGANDTDSAAAASTAAVSRVLRDAVVASILAEARQDQQRLESGGLSVPATMGAVTDSSDGDDGLNFGARWSAAAIFRLDRAARMLEALGRMAEAEVLFRRVLEATEAALGTEHPNTLTSVANLASLLHDQRRLAEAEPLLRRVLSATERALGVTHHETAASLEALAMLLEQQGRMAEAEAAFRRAYLAYESALGASNRDTLAAANNLAHVLRLQGGPQQLEKAESLYRQSLAGYESALGPEHPDTLAAINNLALVLKDLGEVSEAEILYRKALDGCERALGPVHAYTLSAVNNLAAALQTRGDLDAAEELFRRALTGREAELGSSHPDTLGSVNNLAVLLQMRGQYGDAEPLFRRALAGWEEALGPENTDTLTACWNLGVVLEALGRIEEALVLFQREVAGRTKRGDLSRAALRQAHIAELSKSL